MTEWSLGILLATTLVAGYMLTGWLRQLALERGLIDEPNARGSHHVPTPRGGGLAILIVVLAGACVLAMHSLLPLPFLWGLLGSGLLVGGIGWLDDHRDVPVLSRLVVHFAAAIWGLAWIGGLPPLTVLGATFHPGWPGDVLAAIYLVWLLNLYNFMDGIDGIAGIEAATVCLGGVVLDRLASNPSGAWAVAPLMAAAVSGFLVWNFPRARIFMGDVGSGFVGIVLALLSLEAARAAPELLWGWLILLGVFVVDATVTLIRRLLRREAIHRAHHSHAYQHVARRVGAHPPVTLAVGAINVFWLLPLAALVAIGRLDGFGGLALAYAPLVLTALLLGAGRPGGTA